MTGSPRSVRPSSPRWPVHRPGLDPCAAGADRAGPTADRPGPTGVGASHDDVGRAVVRRSSGPGARRCGRRGRAVGQPPTPLGRLLRPCPGSAPSGRRPAGRRVGGRDRALRSAGRPGAPALGRCHADPDRGDDLFIVVVLTSWVIAAAASQAAYAVALWPPGSGGAAGPLVTTLSRILPGGPFGANDPSRSGRAWSQVGPTPLEPGVGRESGRLRGRRSGRHPAPGAAAGPPGDHVVPDPARVVRRTVLRGGGDPPRRRRRRPCTRSSPTGSWSGPGPWRFSVIAVGFVMALDIRLGLVVLALVPLHLGRQAGLLRGVGPKLAAMHRAMADLHSATVGVGVGDGGGAIVRRSTAQPGTATPGRLAVLGRAMPPGWGR